MTAKKMFEELGYELNEKSDKEILYKMKWEISTSYWVSFDLTLKSIMCFMTSDSPFEPSKAYRIELDLLQAINKQIKELNWDD